MTAEEAGTAALAELADEDTNAKAKRLVDTGAAEWRWDPQVRLCVGLVKTGTNHAHVVVYLPGHHGLTHPLSDGDFETDLEFEHLP